MQKKPGKLEDPSPLFLGALYWSDKNKRLAQTNPKKAHSKMSKKGKPSIYDVEKN